MKVGSLFAGIGGFDLGLERAGMRVAWQCEADAFCRAVLARHWPDVPCYPDVRELRGADVEPVDVLCGGFPCQDISSAGRKVGIGGERSGLWAEFARLIGELRPRYVVVENVADILVRGVDVVLSDLAACGYDAEWDCLPASAFGAPHQRDRFWLVAYPNDEGEHAGPVDAEVGGSPPAISDADGRPVESWWKWRRVTQAGRSEWWPVEPSVGRVAHGVPERLDQLAALGNALVPQIAEWLGRRILEYERQAA